MTDQRRERPVLYVFSGLPGSGKTTLAELLAQRLSIAYFRIDTVEQALRELCAIEIQGEGYRLTYRLVTDNLRLGMSAVADSCNPIELTRREWQDVALELDASYVNIEVLCSDADEHRRRVETRRRRAPGQPLPTWKQVEDREYHTWSTDRITIDTAGRTHVECIEELLEQLELPTQFRC